nr:MAG TPA: hypothetical protein [Bacteriophage sp.]
MSYLFIILAIYGFPTYSKPYIGKFSKCTETH